MSDTSPTVSATRRDSLARRLEAAKFRVCDHCRIKKTKCDMTRPTCSSCQSRGAVCTYSQRKKKPGPPKGSQRGPRSLSDASLAVPTTRRTFTATPVFSPSSILEALGAFGEAIDESTYACDLNSTNLFSDDALARQQFFENPFINASPYDSLSLPSPDNCLDLGPELEAYLLNLYFSHLQPIYPLLRHVPSPSSNHTTSGLSLRLKMAVYAVASRFANPDVCKTPISPKMFAQNATNLSRGPTLTLDELKASLLLCIYDMSESFSWDTVTEIARITRMAELYYGMHLDGNRNEQSRTDASGDEIRASDKDNQGSIDHAMEEWKSVWWCIYSLDTSCNAVASFSNAISDNFQSKMALPSVSVPDFTNPALCDSRSHEDKSHFIPSTGRKHWELMRSIFSKASCRNRNLYLGACSLMRSVTELRSLIRQSGGQDLEARLQELESDCTAASFALPPWFFNATRNLGIGETEQQHQNRLDTLLVWFCANLLLPICAAKISCQTTGGAVTELKVYWLAILSKADEVVRVVQNWKPCYFEAADPMCTYIIVLTASVLAYNSHFEDENGATRLQFTKHLDLFELFLDQMALTWPIAHHHGNALKLLRTTLSVRNPTYSEALDYIFRLTSPLSGQLLSPPADTLLLQPSFVEESSSLCFSTELTSARSTDENIQDTMDEQFLTNDWLEELDSECLGGINGRLDLTDITTED